MNELIRKEYSSKSIIGVEVPCGKTMGHGESCSEGWLCASCSYIEWLENRLKEAYDGVQKLQDDCVKMEYIEKYKKPEHDDIFDIYMELSKRMDAILEDLREQQSVNISRIKDRELQKQLAERWL